VLPNAQVLTTIYNTVSAGRVEEIAPHVHPDCVFEDPAELPDGGRHVGRDAVVTYLGEWMRTWSIVWISIEEYHGSGPRRGAGVRIDLRGAASGVTTEMWLFQVVEFEDGLIRHVRGYFDRDEGMAELVGKPA
jgi:ketosteroid isomerase-like protein